MHDGQERGRRLSFLEEIHQENTHGKTRLCKSMRRKRWAPPLNIKHGRETLPSDSLGKTVFGSPVALNLSRGGGMGRLAVFGTAE